MKTFRTALLAAALVMGLVSAAQAENMVRKVDSFDFLSDQSGSMLMGNGINGVTKAANAKKVMTAVNQAIPDLGYQGSLHTFAGSKTVVPYGPWDRASMQAVSMLYVQILGFIFVSFLLALVLPPEEAQSPCRGM